jgi:hypothetical protein
MGLDTRASRVPREMAPEDEDQVLTEEDIRAFQAAKIQLCGYWPGVFRGKMYEGLVLRITGISLYEEWIPPERVQQMYQALERGLKRAQARNTKRTAKTIEHLLRFFRVCVERDLGLVGDW